MSRPGGFLFAACLCAAVTARAENTEDVVAGSDVALTGGAVVANVHTGGAMWFNPAGVARLDSRSVDLTGAVLSYSAINAPGALSIETGEQSEGDFSAIQAIPRALTVVASPRPQLRWGIGFFFSRSRTRYFQDRVESSEGAAESSEFFASTDETRNLYHVSSTLAWKKDDKFLLGGSFDIVIANRRITELVAGGWEGGAGGTFNRSSNSAVSGAGLQLKGGFQWQPGKRFRLGWMAATPSYLVYLNNETTITSQSVPPGEDPVFSGSQRDDLGGAWVGVERGLTRLGGAIIGKRWGWVEVDLIVGFPLVSPEFDIDWKTTANVRAGGVFKITERLKFGAGFFTDFSPEREPDRFGDTQVTFYGATVGLDFANRAAPPERGEGGFYLAFAVALRYAHGSGTLGGFVFPASYPPPPEEPLALNLVDLRVNEFAINLAVKASF